MKGESRREKGEKREEVDRIKWRWRSRLAVGEWKMREREWANIGERKEEEKKKDKRERVERRGNVAVLSPVTHTDVWEGEEEQVEDRRENKGAEKVKETTSEEEKENEK